VSGHAWYAVRRRIFLAHVVEYALCAERRAAPIVPGVVALHAGCRLAGVLLDFKCAVFTLRD